MRNSQIVWIFKDVIDVVASFLESVSFMGFESI